MKSSFHGFDELQNELERLQQNVDKTMNEFNGDVPLEKLFSFEFMQEHTEFDDINEWFSNGGFKFNTQEEYDNLDESALNTYVKSSTDFHTWQEMLEAASTEAITASLDF